MPKENDFRGVEKPSQENINKPRPYTGGNTYLHELCIKNAPLPLVREAVLQLGADIKALNDKNFPPLGKAIMAGNLEIIQCLIDLGAELYFPTGGGHHFNAAAVAVLSGQVDVLNLILKNGGGIYINEPGTGLSDKEDMPCLSIAVRDYSANMIEPLVAAGSFLDMESGAEKLTPLQLAVTLPDRIIFVEKLLQQGVRIDCPQSVNGQAALHYAILAGNDAAAECLLKYGADPEALTAEGLTPLMLCAKKGRSNIAGFLLKAGADVNMKRLVADQETPLHIAAAEGNAEMVDILLNKGANPLLTDVFNQTALRYAERNGPSYYIGYRTVIEKLKESETAAERTFFEKAYYKFPPRP